MTWTRKANTYTAGRWRITAAKPKGLYVVKFLGEELGKIRTLRRAKALAEYVERELTNNGN